MIRSDLIGIWSSLEPLSSNKVQCKHSALVHCSNRRSVEDYVKSLNKFNCVVKIGQFNSCLIISRSNTFSFNIKYSKKIKYNLFFKSHYQMHWDNHQYGLLITISSSKYSTYGAFTNRTNKYLIDRFIGWIDTKYSDCLNDNIFWLLIVFVWFMLLFLMVINTVR